MTRGKKYNDEDVERGLQALAETGGNAAAASRMTDIPATTLRGWKEKHFDEFVEVRREKRGDFISEVWAAVEEALERIRQEFKHMDGKDLAVAFGILVDKALVMGGEPDTISETKISDARHTLEGKLRQAVDASTEEEIPGESD